MRSLLLATSVWLAALPAAALAAPPARVQLDWDLTKDGSTIAVIVQRLEHGNGRYSIFEAWEGRGLYRLMGHAKRSSRGEVLAGALRPLEYADERSGRDPESARFDWKARSVTYQHKGPATTVPLPPHPTDELAALFGFSFKPPAEAMVPQDVVTGRGVSDRVFRNEGRETYASKAGTFEAVKLVRRKDNGERAEIWLAADRDYLPVRIVLVDRKGTRIDQVLTRIAAF